MGVGGHTGGESLALQRVFNNIIKLFLDGRLSYTQRTIHLMRDLAPDSRRLRKTRKDSQQLQPVRRLEAALEGADVN